MVTSTELGVFTISFVRRCYFGNGVVSNTTKFLALEKSR